MILSDWKVVVPVLFCRFTAGWPVASVMLTVFIEKSPGEFSIDTAEAVVPSSFEMFVVPEKFTAPSEWSISTPRSGGDRCSRCRTHVRLLVEIMDGDGRAVAVRDGEVASLERELAGAAVDQNAVGAGIVERQVIEGHAPVDIREQDALATAAVNCDPRGMSTFPPLVLATTR